MANETRKKTAYSLTPASANKLLRQFREKLSYLYGKEQKLSSYILITGEEPVKPDYDLDAFRQNVGAIMDNTLILKHAVNTFNTSTTVGQTGLTVDQVLVKMAMLNREKEKMDAMRRVSPKEVRTSMRSNNAHVEYDVANFSPEMAERYYQQFDEEITSLQLSLDCLNNTASIKVELYEYDI